MKALTKLAMISIAAVSLFITACSPVTVPPAHKGKFLTPSGYQPEVLEPGKYWEGFREDTVLIETGTDVYKERVIVKLEDKLSLTIEVRFRGRISGDEKVLNAMFNDITTTDIDTISFSMIYGIYGRDVVRETVRKVVSQYNVDEVHLNYARLGDEITAALQEPLSRSPIDLSEFSIGDIDYPDVVNKAIEAAEERRLAITREEAQAEIDMTKKRNEQRLAEADYKVRMTKAKAIRDENLIIGEGVTPQLLELKRLEVAEKLAEGSNEASKVFLPVEALSSTGANVEMFRGKN
tara:strand:- start:900 stop:1778 length:879 start_codon:yes stop_codon:yes gene_type:complete